MKIWNSNLDHLIEIGTGWGGMAILLPSMAPSNHNHYLANAQYAKKGPNAAEDRITLLFEDYRDLTISFDKLVSIEMIEAVEHEYFDTYFDCVSKLLKPDGKR